ncbi:uncharacterized protein TNCV_2790551 [Trichonephila clavipes]|nr:uncharacterized protein TNCV_2790551 [Trichonephila clavipes]
MLGPPPPPESQVLPLIFYKLDKYVYSRTEVAIRANRRLKLKELHQIIPEGSMITLYEVVTVKLGYRKLCARWVPNILTEEHQKKRMCFALDFLTRYADAEDEFFDRIVTGNETARNQSTTPTIKMGSFGPSAIQPGPCAQRLLFIPLPEVTSWWKSLHDNDEIKDEVEKCGSDNRRQRSMTMGYKSLCIDVTNVWITGVIMSKNNE